jgi:hypothetical protein
MSKLTECSTDKGAQVTAHSTAGGRFAVIRNGALALVMGASLTFGSLGFATSADARVPEGRQDELASFCRALQNDFDQLMTEYVPVSDPRFAEYQEELSHIMGAWNGFCRGSFGNISVRRITATDSPVHVQDIATASDNQTNNSPVGTSVSHGTRLSVR